MRGPAPHDLTAHLREVSSAHRGRRLAVARSRSPRVAESSHRHLWAFWEASLGHFVAPERPPVRQNRSERRGIEPRAAALIRHSARAATAVAVLEELQLSLLQERRLSRGPGRQLSPGAAHDARAREQIVELVTWHHAETIEQPRAESHGLATGQRAATPGWLRRQPVAHPRGSLSAADDE